MKIDRLFTLRACILPSFLLACTTLVPAQSARSIDPLLGADGDGNVFVGPSLPYGMAKPGPDIGDNTSNSGWSAKGDLNGFAQLHVSGTGGAPKYGNILVQPTTGTVAPSDSASARLSETAKAGYYSVRLAKFNITAEITATRHASLYRLRFPSAEQGNILIDVGHVLAWTQSATGHGSFSQFITEAHVRINSPKEISGSASVLGGWNDQTRPYTIYFTAITDQAASASGTWLGSTIRPGKSGIDYILGNYPAPKRSGLYVDAPRVTTGAYLSYDSGLAPLVHMKVGLSFISVEQARKNALGEIPGFDFDGTRAAAVTAWDQALSNIRVETRDPDELIKLSTALYHVSLMPVDRSGENPDWSDDAPYYDDFYCIWDTYRTSMPLLTLIDQPRVTDMIRSLIDIQQHEGFLPDGRSGNFTGVTQGGSNADMVLADAYVKHVPGVDWQAAYKAVLADAETDPKDYIRWGRGDLKEWRERGFLSIEGSRSDRSGSRQMEYAANDFAISSIAHGLGKTDDEAKYLKRAAQWRNLWDSDAVAHTEAGDIHGFIWPKHKNGTWRSDFSAAEAGTWDKETFYEGSSWTYSLDVPHDVQGLITLSGGVGAFKRRLDLFFAAHAEGRFDVGNEPGFLSPYLYIWAGRQSDTARQVRQVLARSFHTGPKGLPGNDDSGAMSSLYVFGKLGFFPVAGQDIYVIGSPFFPSAAIQLPNGKTFTVLANRVSAQNRYIATARWNGKLLDRAWFTHGELLKGGRLEFEMTEVPTHWDLGAPPPSLSHDSTPQVGSKPSRSISRLWFTRCFALPAKRRAKQVRLLPCQNC